MINDRRRAQRISGDFRNAQLGDARLTKRAVNIVEKVARQPSLPLPVSMGSTAALEATYRFMNNSAVSLQRLYASHRDEVVERARRCASQEVLVIHDTTTCQFGHLDPAEIGYLQTGAAGFFLHIALIVDAGLWRRPLGVVHAETIHRAERSRRGGRKQRTHGAETATWNDREALRWNRSVTGAAEALQGVGSVIHVADRETDSYQLMAHMLSLDQRFVLRVRHDRRARAPGDEAWGKLNEVVEGFTGRMARSVPLSRRAQKTAPHANQAHPAREARTAQLKFSAGQVELPRPRYVPTPETITLNVVHVIEEEPPPGEEPVEWLLYTTEPVRTKEDIARVVDIYRTRWVIEEFNKALKTGCMYEDRGFESRHALLTMLALSIPIACELLWLRSRARTEPDGPASNILSQQQLMLLRRLHAKLPVHPTARQALLAIAALGGHQRANGEPGWLVLQRGLSQLRSCEVGWELANTAQQRGKM